MKPKVIASLAVSVVGCAALISWIVLGSAGPKTPSDEITDSTCADSPNGTACGAAGYELQCMNGACGKNACGDSVVFEKEQCDDGNALDGDGCGATCRWEALAGCGNGSVDEGEECDDHNTVDDDACTLRCTVARCGDGVKASSEQCDDGNSSDVDGCTATCIASTEVQLAAAGLRVHSGDAALDKSRDLKSSVSTGSSSSGTGSNGSSTLTSTASSHPALPGFGARAGTGAAGKNGGSSASARSGGGSGSSASVGVNTSPLRTADDDPEAACEACRNANCRTYLGTDLVAGCYEAVNTDFGATAGDASFLLACQEVMNCAKTNKCGFDSNQASTCYCGSTNIDECAANGPGEDAPCVHEWQMATQSTQNMQILERMTDQRYPAAWAFHLLECERKVCPACIPKT